MANVSDLDIIKAKNLNDILEDVSNSILDETVLEMARPIASQAMDDLVEEFLTAKWLDNFVAELLGPILSEIARGAAMDHVAETMADSLCGEIVSVMASSTANEVVLEAQADSQAESMAHEFDEIDRYGIELCDRLALTQLLDVIGSRAEAQVAFDELTTAFVDTAAAQQLTHQCISIHRGLQNHRSTRFMQLPLDVLSADLMIEAMSACAPRSLLPQHLLDSHRMITPPTSKVISGD